MRIEFSAEIEVPDGTPLADVEQWLSFELGERCSLSGDNAMVHTDLVTVGCRRVYARECWRSAPHPKGTPNEAT